MSDERTYSIGSLAEAAGVSRRTVRFYVQRNLLPPPEGLGRGAHYAAAHLERLLRIKAWQEQGVPLEEIPARLEDRGPRIRLDHPDQAPGPPERALSPRHQTAPPPPAVPGQSWLRQPLAAGYELHVGAGRAPLDSSQLAALARTLFDILRNGGSR